MPLPPTPPRVVSADDLCIAAENTLVAGLMPMVELLGKTDHLKPICDWQQLPEQRALVVAELPAVGISSPGLIGTPQRSAASGWSATWRVNVGVFDRGTTHHDTAGRARDWAAAVRAVLISSRTLGGVASSVTWATEEYALYPQKDAARTFGACVVGINVLATDVLDLSSVDPRVLRTEPSTVITP